MRSALESAAVATVMVALAATATEADGQQLVPRPADAPRIYWCFDGPFEQLQMSLEADRRPMMDETAFVVTRAAFSNTGELVVIDATAGEVMKVARNLDVLARFGRQGEGPGEFGRPVDAGIDSEGRVWILDGEPPSLVLFDSAGEFVREIPLPAQVERLAIGNDAIYVSTRVRNLGRQREHPILWRYDPSSEQVEPILSFSPSWVGRPPVYQNVMTQTIPRVGLDGQLYLGFVESNEVWRVRDDGSHELAVRGCLPDELRDAYTARDPQGRPSGIMISDFGQAGVAVVRDPKQPPRIAHQAEGRFELSGPAALSAVRGDVRSVRGKDPHLLRDVIEHSETFGVQHDEPAKPAEGRRAIAIDRADAQ